MHSTSDTGHQWPGPRRHHGHGGPPLSGRHGGFGGPGFGGPGFGFGGPGFGGRGSGRRRAGRGDTRASVLALLAEQPRHGYQIITELSERSGGRWKPSPGSIYPVLQQLQDEGLIRPEEDEGRRVFHLTDTGRAYVEEHKDELLAPWEAVAGSPHEGTAKLFHLFKQTAAAAWQVAQTGSEAQLAQAREVLAETRRSLYRILAEDEPASADEPDDASGATEG